MTEDEKKKANRKIKKYKHRIVRNVKRYIKGWKKDIEKGKNN